MEAGNLAWRLTVGILGLSFLPLEDRPNSGSQD